MSPRIKTKRTWEKHLPQKARRVQRGSYRSPRPRQQKIVLRIILFIIIIFLLQGIFQAKYFKIEKIDINNTEDLSRDEILSTIDSELTATKYLIFKNNNYFLTDTDKLEEVLIEKYNLDDAQIEKKWADTLQITVKEKISHFIWAKDDSLYLLDAKGALNRQIGARDDKYLIIIDLRDYRPQGDQIFGPEEMENINQIYLGWQDIIGSKVRLTEIVIYNDWSLDLKTDKGFYVKIDINEDIKEQIKTLNAVLSQDIAGGDIDYIDVRFGDKVYFK